jgi:uncharacterized protein (DUF433 family)
MEAMQSLRSTALNESGRAAAAGYWFQHQHIFQNAAMEAVRSLWRVDNAALQAFRADAFAGTLLTYIREHELATDEALQELEGIVDEKLKNLPRGGISADGILNVILTIVLFLANIAYQELHEPSSALTEAQVDRIVQAIEKTKTLALEREDSVYYIVEHAIAVHIKPNNRSASVAMLYPNQKVRLVQRSHQWIYVEYFDYIEGLPKSGWTRKKYLKRAQEVKLLQQLLTEFGDSSPGIESRAGVAGGVPCVVRTRIPVWLLEQARRLGTSDADLLKAYPILRAQDLANAWAYARTHREEIEQQIAENESDEPQ